MGWGALAKELVGMFEERDLKGGEKLERSRWRRGMDLTCRCS